MKIKTCFCLLLYQTELLRDSPGLTADFLLVIFACYCPVMIPYVLSVNALQAISSSLLTCCSAECWLLSLLGGLQSVGRFPPIVPCNTFTSRGFQLSLMACVHSGMQLTPEHSAFIITGLRRVTHRTVVHYLRWSHDVTSNERRYYRSSHHAGDAVVSVTINVHIVIGDVYFYGRRSGSGDYTVYVS